MLKLFSEASIFTQPMDANWSGDALNSEFEVQ